MFFSKISGSANPVSHGFNSATRTFNDLTTNQRILIALSIIAGLTTLYLVGSRAYKAWFDTSEIEKKSKGTDSTADKTDKQMPKEKIDFKSLSLDELLERSNGIPLRNNLSIESPEAVKVSEDQREINEMIGKRVVSMEETDQRKVLDQVKTSPEKFILVVSQLSSALSSRYVIASVCQFLESIEWPNSDLKKEYIPNLLLPTIIRKGIAWDNWESGFIETEKSSEPFNKPGFACHTLLVHTKKILGRGYFNEPISPFLAKSLGLAIQLAAKGHIEELKEKIGKDEKDNLRIGLKLDIGQFSETRFTAPVIAPLLPYLREVPGIVSLNLSDIGTDSPENAFSQVHAQTLLDIVRSQPFLWVVNINIQGMSKEEQGEFSKELKKILSDPARTQPSAQKYISFYNNEKTV